MVTNSFVKRNAMQPMGRPKQALKAPCFSFLFSFGGGGGEGFFFHFSLVPNVFSLCSLQVSNGFSICSPNSQCVPQHVRCSNLTFFPYVLANVVLLSTI
jgi:hypothetical protein